jgi:site-specific DNA-methyltransferase (adenine-specific)
MDAWGFTYCTFAFTWIKTNKDGSPFFGVGYYTKSNPEICLLGRKGKPIKVSDSVSSVIISPKLGHSQKPPEARSRIEQLCGDVPRIELFAREKVAGWEPWGNQI